MPTRPPLRALLIDLSGTLHVGNHPTPGAVEALARLRAANIPFRFCSNTSKESTESMRKKLERMGFSGEGGIQSNELWTSIGVIGGVLKERGIQRYSDQPVLYGRTHTPVIDLLCSQLSQPRKTSSTTYQMTAPMNRDLTMLLSWHLPLRNCHTTI